MAGKGVVGKLAVKVSPDTSQFLAKLKKDLEAIEKRLKDLKVEVTVIAELDRSSLERVKRQLEGIKATAKVKAELSKAEVAKLKRQIEKAKPKVDAGLSQASAQKIKRRLDELGGKVKVDTDLDRASLEKVKKQVSNLKADAPVKSFLEKDSLAKVRTDLERLKGKAKVDLELDKDQINRVSNKVKELKTKTKVDIEMTKEDVDKLRARLRDIKEPAKIVPELDKSELEKTKRKLRGLDFKATINANLDKAKAWLGLKTLTRPRFVEIIPRLNSAAVAKVAGALAALSGARALNELRRNIYDFVSGLDKSVLIIGSVVSALGLLGSAAGSAVGTLAALGNLLASMGPGLLALPGIFLGAATGIGIFYAAVKDVKEVLGDLGPAFTELQQSISGEFWGRAAQPIRDMVNTLLPEVREEVLGIAAAYGDWAAAIANVGSGRVDVIRKSLEHVRRASGIATRGVGLFAQGIIDLGLVGTKVLPDLANQFNRLGERFANWAEKGANDGSIERSIRAAAKAAKQLWDILKNLGGALSGFAKAAEKGGYTLDRMVDGARKLNEAINSVRGQKVLSNIFQGARQGMDAFYDSIGRLGPEVEKISETMNLFFTKSGQAAGQLATVFAKIFSQSSVNLGILDFFVGFQKGLSYLEKAAPQMGQLMGSVSRYAGKMAENIGKVLGAAFEHLGPVVSKFLDALGPVVDVLGDYLVMAIEKAAPWLQKVVDWFAGMKPEDIVKIGGAILGLTAAFQGLSAVGGLLNGASGIGGLLSLFGKMPPQVAIVVGVIAVLVGAFALLYTKSETFRNFVSTVWDTVWTAWQGAVDYFNSNIKPLLDQIWADALSGLQEAWRWLTEEMGPEFRAVWELIKELWETVGRPALDVMVQYWGSQWEALKKVIEIVWPIVKAIIQASLKYIQGIINIFLGLIQGDWSRVWEGVKQIASGAWILIKQVISSNLSLIGSVVNAAVSLIKSVWSTHWNAVAAISSAIWGRIKAVVSAGVNGLAGIIRGAGGAMANAARAVMNSLLAPFRWGVNQVRNLMRNMTAKLPSWKGPAPVDRVLLKPAGEMIMKGFLNGLESGIPMVKKALNGLTAEISPEVSVGLPEVSGSAGGPTLNITNYYPVAQKDSKIRDEVAQGIALAGAI